MVILKERDDTFWKSRLSPGLLNAIIYMMESGPHHENEET